MSRNIETTTHFGDTEFVKQRQLVCYVCGMLTAGIIAVEGMSSLKKQMTIKKLVNAARKTGYTVVIGDVQNCARCGRSFKDEPVEHVNVDKEGNETRSVVEQ